MLGAYKTKKGTITKYKNLKCKPCSTVLRSYRTTMRNHILTCTFIEPKMRDTYKQSTLTLKTGNSTECSTSESILNHLAPSLRRRDITALENQALKFAISANLSFNALCDPEFRKLLQMLNPSAQIASRHQLATNVLDRVHRQNLNYVSEMASRQSYVSISLDGWLTPGRRKWLGFCRIFRCAGSSRAVLDLSRLEDVTAESEGELVIKREIEVELQSIARVIDSKPELRLVSVITDSAGGNMKAKRLLEEQQNNVLFPACFAHQLNLFAGNLLTHSSTQQTVRRSKELIGFFNGSPTQRASLERAMIEVYGESFSLISDGVTRWYSHYEAIVRLEKSKEVLERFKIQRPREGISCASRSALNMLDTIGSVSCVLLHEYSDLLKLR